MERLTDLTEFDEQLIAAKIDVGQEVVVQFSKPIYSPELLARVDSLAQKFGEMLQVRFFGHYNTTFDCSILKHVPSARNLAVDCLLDVENPEVLHEMQNLAALSIGVYGELPEDFLDNIAFHKLTRLNLSEGKTTKLDLQPIQKMRGLRDLAVAGYSRGIEVLQMLPDLQRLRLARIKKSVRLEFVSRITRLRDFTLILGGRESIEEISHPDLTTLEIIRVLGFSKLDTTVFPRLRALLVEDQIKLPGLEFRDADSPLQLLRVINCKTFQYLRGLRLLGQLNELRISRTAIEFQHLIASGLPRCLGIFGFYTGKPTENRRIREQLDNLGYKEWAQ